MRVEPSFRSSVVKIPAKVGECTCMGSIGWDDITNPSPFGNGFSFFGAPYPLCINMDAENLEKLVKNGTLLGGAVQVKLYEDLASTRGRHYAIVTDNRIPSRDWFRASPRIPVGEADLVADMEKTLAEIDARFSATEHPKSGGVPGVDFPSCTVDEATGEVSIIYAPYVPKTRTVYRNGEEYTIEFGETER